MQSQYSGTSFDNGTQREGSYVEEKKVTLSRSTGTKQQVVIGHVCKYLMFLTMHLLLGSR